MKEIEADKNKEKGRKGNKSKYTKNIADFLQQMFNINPNHASDFYNKYCVIHIS